MFDGLRYVISRVGKVKGKMPDERLPRELGPGRRRREKQLGVALESAKGTKGEQEPGGKFLRKYVNQILRAVE